MDDAPLSNDNPFTYLPHPHIIFHHSVWRSFTGPCHRRSFVYVELGRQIKKRGIRYSLALFWDGKRKCERVILLGLRSDAGKKERRSRKCCSRLQVAGSTFPDWNTRDMLEEFG